MASELFSLVGPALGRAAGAVVGKQLREVLTERSARRKAEEACVASFEQWLVALIKDLEECQLTDQDLRAVLPDYLEALEEYLKDEEVSAELLKPFTEPVSNPRLDGNLLVRRWNELKLPDSPEQFNPDRACRWYVEELNQKRQVIEVLRPHWQSQAMQAQVDHLSAMRGSWADWDVDRYADAMRETYQALDITTLELEGRFDPDDEQIRLKDVFIPQHVRRSRPHRILPRDYLNKRREVDQEIPNAFAEERFPLKDEDLESHWEKTPREPVFDVFASDSVEHLIILGDPGAGKSCLARYVTL